MRAKPTPESDSPDTDACIDAKSPATTPLNDTAEMVAAALVADATGHHGRSRFFEDGADGSGDVLDGFVTDVTTIAQSQCERWESYADIETLICHLPIDHLTFAAHDASAPYAGPYPMAIHVRAALLTEINGWDETALYDYLRAHPSLRQNLGFETLPNHAIVMAARACEVPLPDRMGTDGADGPEVDTPPKHQLVARPTRSGSRPNRSWPTPSRSIAGRTGRSTRTRSGSNTPT